jgi:hypothetical protein
MVTKSSCNPRAQRASSASPLCVAPAFPDHGQKGLDQRIGARDARLAPAELLDIDLRMLRPFRGGAD